MVKLNQSSKLVQRRAVKMRGPTFKFYRISNDLLEIANFLNEWHLPELDERDAKKLAKKVLKISNIISKYGQNKS